MYIISLNELDFQTRLGYAVLTENRIEVMKELAHVQANTVELWTTLQGTGVFIIKN